MTCIWLIDIQINFFQGVILVSFGSAVKPSQMTKEKRAIFLDVFSQLGELMIDLWWCSEEHHQYHNISCQRSTQSYGSEPMISGDGSSKMEIIILLPLRGVHDQYSPPIQRSTQSYGSELMI